jgi:hypothetical protein
MTAAQQVHRGKTSWKILIKAGKSEDGSRKRGRKPIVSNYFSGELLD